MTTVWCTCGIATATAGIIATMGTTGITVVTTSAVTTTVATASWSLVTTTAATARSSPATTTAAVDTAVRAAAER